MENVQLLNNVLKREVDGVYEYTEDDRGRSGSDCSFSGLSETSTMLYEQEPYETLQDKVKELIVQIFPKHTTDQVKVMRMRGGGFNRIIAVNVQHSKGTKASWLLQLLGKAFDRCFGNNICLKIDDIDQYIVRIPRFLTTGMDHQVKTLEFIAGRVGYPVPKVISYSTTNNDNPLGQGYMVQERLPGEPLDLLWPALTPEQRKSGVFSISQILLNLNKISHNSAGLIARTNTLVDAENGVKLETLAVPAMGTSYSQFKKPNTFPSEPQTTIELLTSLCERWRELQRGLWGSCHDVVWDGFLDMIQKLRRRGFLPDEDVFYFCHQDFQLRNLLGRPRGDSIEITGILDWDSAIFAPKFVTHRAPFFLWQDEKSEEDDENAVHLVSKSSEEAEYKIIFENTVGSEYLRYAYSPEYILARRMFFVLQHGIKSDWQLDSAKSIIADFESLPLQS